MTWDAAQQWARESRVISKDELTIAVVGHQPIQSKLSQHQCSLPCKDSNDRPVILAVTLLQLGAKIISPVSNDAKVPEQGCVTVALTAWQDGWSESEWRRAVDATYPFFKALLGKTGYADSVESMWGRSLRHAAIHDSQGQPVQSIQVHAAVRQQKLPEILAASGFNALYATPKSGEGRIAGGWRVIWVTGGTARLHALAAETQGCAGLVRSKRSFGLHFSSEKFPAAWKVINGDAEMPSDLEIKKVYKVEPLPFGSTAEMLRNWSQAISWPLRPIKALGARCWLLGSNVPPPQGIVMFNSEPVIIRRIPGKNSGDTHPVLAGPKPSKYTAQKSNLKGNPQDDPWGPYFDPWNKAVTPSTSPPTANSSGSAGRVVQGPIEAKFTAHEARLTQMEQTIEALQVSSNQLRTETQQGFAAVAEREKQVQTAIGQVRTDLEQSMKTAIAQQSTQLAASIDELKQLMVKKSKRSRSKGPGQTEIGQDMSE